MRITEPVTMLTDYAIVAACLYFAVSLGFGIRPVNRTARRLWVLGFIATGVAALAGGTFHGFALMLAPATLQTLWNVTLLSIGASSAFIVAAALASSIKKTDESRAWLIRGLIVTVVGVMFQLTGFRHGSDFNHNDVFHVIQIGGLYLFFRGARLVR
jgi:hypothetical protein